MKKKEREQAISNTKIAVVFFVFLTLVVGISLIFKVIAVMRSSQFDDSKRFTLSIADGKNIEIMSLDPGLKDITVFKLKDNIQPYEAGRQLAIPIDGFISSDSLDLNQKADSLFIKTILNYGRLKTNLTIVDLFKLAMFIRTIPESAINVKIAEDASGLGWDRVVGRLVGETLIEKDNQTIKILNGAGVDGLGNRLARLITNMGGDVIMVATEDRLINKSKISYIDKKTYTVERLQKVLGYEAVKEAENAISDITIVIGKDKITENPF